MCKLNEMVGFCMLKFYLGQECDEINYIIDG